MLVMSSHYLTDSKPTSRGMVKVQDEQNWLLVVPFIAHTPLLSFLPIQTSVAPMGFSPITQNKQSKSRISMDWEEETNFGSKSWWCHIQLIYCKIQYHSLSLKLIMWRHHVTIYIKNVYSQLNIQFFTFSFT